MSSIQRHPKFKKVNFEKKIESKECNFEECKPCESKNSCDFDICDSLNSKFDCSEECKSDNKSEDCCQEPACYSEECCNLIKESKEKCGSLDFKYCKPHLKECKPCEKVPSFEVCFGKIPAIKPIKMKFRKCKKCYKKPPKIHIPTCKCVEIPEIKIVEKEICIPICRPKNYTKKCKNCKCEPECRCDSENRCSANCKC